MTKLASYSYVAEIELTCQIFDRLANFIRFVSFRSISVSIPGFMPHPHRYHVIRTQSVGCKGVRDASILPAKFLA